MLFSTQKGFITLSLELVLSMFTDLLLRVFDPRTYLCADSKVLKYKFKFWILRSEFRDLKSEGLQAIVKFSMHSTLIIISPIVFCHIDFFIPAKSAR